jgi:hypothetical protein
MSQSKNKIKRFPCPICKGQGEYVDDVIQGVALTYGCGYCDHQGLIEVNGLTHNRIRAEKLAKEILRYRVDLEDTGLDYSDLLELGYKALNLELEKKHVTE